MEILEYQEILEYLQITNKQLEIPITVVEDCADFSQDLAGVYVYFENEDKFNIMDKIVALGTIEATHCSQLFEQAPVEAYKILLKRSGWNSFTEYFINKFGSINEIFVYLNKGNTDALAQEQQNFFTDAQEEDLTEEDTTVVAQDATIESSEDDDVTLAQETSEGDSEGDTTLAQKTSEGDSEGDITLAQESSKAKEIEDFIDSMILARELEEEEEEKNREKEKISKRKKELHNELNSLLKSNNSADFTFNYGISARDLAKWKEKQENFKKENSPAHSQKNFETPNKKEEDNNDEGSCPCKKDNNAPPGNPNQNTKPEEGEKEQTSTEESEVISESNNSEIIDRGEELRSESNNSEISTKDPTVKEVPQKEEEDKLEVPHLIGNLIELVVDTKTSMTGYKTSLENTIEESKTSLSEEITDAKDSLEDTIRESKVSIEKTVNFLENTLTESKTLLDEEIRNGKTEVVDALAQYNSSLEEEIKDGKTEVVDALAQYNSSLEEEIKDGKTEVMTYLSQSHSSIENIEEMIQKNHELLESLTDKMDSQDLANVTKNVLEVCNTVSEEQRDNNANLQEKVEELNTTLAEFQKEINSKLTINSEIHTEIKQFNEALTEFKNELSGKLETNTEQIIDTKSGIQTLSENCKEIVTMIEGLQEKFGSVFYQEDDDDGF